MLVLCAVVSSPPLTAQVDVSALLQRVDDLLRGDSSHATMTMRVKTRRFERTLSLEVWSKGTERSLVRVLSPAKERGTATLRVDDQVWNYLPKVDRTIKVPASMMSGAWLGSHFSNNDLVREVRFSEDYDCALDDSATDDASWRIRCVPHEDVPVVWGAVEIVVDRGSGLPEATRYYDERGELTRTMTFEDLRDIGGRVLPTRLRVVPADASEEMTEMVYEDLELDVPVDDALFSLRALRQ
ncbi:MAG: outer membrane lipoprotein-sorting protein [Acidobacteria bacterium]|nr:MAG: outer membrane lipoprotein-sorting protein [Acidobacteriota bacterium]